MSDYDDEKVDLQIDALEAEVQPLRSALEQIVALDDDETDPGLSTTPDYWAGIGDAAAIAREVLSSSGESES